MVVDGLGHGILAAEAAREAERIFALPKFDSPTSILEESHGALKKTRGAAMAVSALHLDRQLVSFAGVGNIGASIVTSDTSRGMASHNGTVGHHLNRIQEFTFPWNADSILVMYSDGLKSGWDLHRYPGIWSKHPALIAGVLYRDYCRERDDVTVLVAKNHPRGKRTMKLKLLNMEIRYEHDVVLARQRARTIAAALKFDAQAQTRIATAVSEVVRNAFQYAGGGAVEFEIDNGVEKMMLISVRDQGPGIGNLEEILGGKYVSKTGMGLGMIGAKRLLDRFQVETRKGDGTTVILGKLIPLKFARLSESELQGLLSNIERKPSESPYEELQQQNKELMRTLEELRARQAELAQLNRELDETNRGVVALYAELNDKADFLQRASELKSHFLSNMSHEFRTPLNSILALSQILIDRMDGELGPEQEKQVTFIRRSAQDLTDLVNDLLDLAKVEAGKVTIRPTTFSVESLFAALRGMLRPLLAQNSSVTLVFESADKLPELHTDEAKVSQVLRNFISNALKFTERGEVRVSARTSHDGTIVFSVADTGIGIAPADQDRIFKEWEQVEGKFQKAAKGTGLGLPLSKKLTQLLGGDVYVKSDVGHWLDFFCRRSHPL